jgi:hypothetical protein
MRRHASNVNTRSTARAATQDQRRHGPSRTRVSHACVAPSMQGVCVCVWEWVRGRVCASLFVSLRACGGISRVCAFFGLLLCGGRGPHAVGRVRRAAVGGCGTGSRPQGAGITRACVRTFFLCFSLLFDGAAARTVTTSARASAGPNTSPFLRRKKIRGKKAMAPTAVLLLSPDDITPERAVSQAVTSSDHGGVRVATGAGRLSTADIPAAEFAVVHVSPGTADASILRLAAHALVPTGHVEVDVGTEVRFVCVCVKRGGRGLFFFFRETPLHAHDSRRRATAHPSHTLFSFKKKSAGKRRGRAQGPPPGRLCGPGPRPHAAWSGDGREAGVGGRRGRAPEEKGWRRGGGRRRGRVEAGRRRRGRRRRRRRRPHRRRRPADGGGPGQASG